jgi:hypothetical protein
VGVALPNRCHGRCTTIGPLVRPAPPSAASLDPDAIRRVVVRNLGQVRRCYETALAEAPTAEGRVAVRWVIGGDGAVLNHVQRRR